ncbi:MULTISPECIES: hypothetical protein [unclassified Streptomyces]|nr:MULTISPECIES: hypothetical protein [unclassified Streptomyces]MCU4749880.1 hypothetical protein [Streptomyces sp. G-5]QQN76174.1 hypothetical protein IPZ77_01010 [Streptomyces sp. XC 2026]
MDIMTVSRLVCAAALVDVRLHENGIRSTNPWTVRRGADGKATPVTR